MIYRKMDHDGGTGTNGPRNSIRVQESTTKKSKLHKMEHRLEEPRTVLITPGSAGNVS